MSHLKPWQQITGTCAICGEPATYRYTSTDESAAGTLACPDHCIAVGDHICDVDGFAQGMPLRASWSYWFHNDLRLIRWIRKPFIAVHNRRFYRRLARSVDTLR